MLDAYRLLLAGLSVVAVAQLAHSQRVSSHMHTSPTDARPLRRAALGLTVAIGLLAGAAPSAEAKPKPAKLKPQMRSVTPGDEFGVAVKNRTAKRITFGLGFGYERRVDGRWVDARDEICPDFRCGVPDIGLAARPRETVGPQYGQRLVDRVRVPVTAPTSRYRITKSIGRSNTPVRTTFRVSDGELLPSSYLVAPGKSVRFRVRNTGSLSIEYGLGIFGGSIERLDGRDWVDARSEVCQGNSCSVNAVGLLVAPGEIRGPRFGKSVDRIRFRKTAESGLYRVTKGVSFSGRREDGSLEALVEVDGRPDRSIPGGG